MPFRFELYLDELLCLAQSGEIPMARIDDAVERILRVKFISGIFEHPFADRSLLEIVGCKVFQDIAIFSLECAILILCYFKIWIML